MPTEQLLKIWVINLSGGPVMLALFALAILLYWNVLSLLLFIGRLRARQAIAATEQRIDRSAIAAFRDKLRQIVTTQLKYAHVLIVAAPLLGLLGTVMGMLDTFRGIGAESGDDTTKAVADGVKVALITTQTGLMIAIFGVFVTQWIARLHRGKDHELLEIELETMKKGLEA